MENKVKFIFVSVLFCLLYGIISWLFIENNPHYYDPCKFWGKGTKEHPYVIATATDLARLRDAVNLGYQFKDKYFEQVFNIDLEGEIWQPIGNSQGRFFCGHYDGRGHVIKNLHIETDDSAALFVGMSGSIKNLGLESGRIQGDHVASFVVSGSSNAVIKNCYSKVEILGKKSAADLVADYTGRVDQCLYLGETSDFSKNINGEYIREFNQKLRDSLGKRQEKEKYDGKKRMDLGDVCYLTLRDGQVEFARWGGFDHNVPRGIKLELARNLAGKYSAVVILCLVFIFMFLRRRHVVQAEATCVEEAVVKDSRAFNYSCFIMTLIFLVVGLASANKVLKTNNSDSSPMRCFYEQDAEKIDALICGSSMVGANIDAVTLWKEYGISSYVLWGSGQPYWNTYYYLEEVLKYGRPQVIVLDARMLFHNVEYHALYQQYANTIDMNINGNWLENIQVTTEQKNWLELAAGFPIYHNRYNDIQKKNFFGSDIAAPSLVDKGWRPIYGHGNIINLDVGSGNTKVEVSHKQEYYLRKILELCCSREIPVVLVAAATSNRDEYRRYVQYAENIAGEYGVDFVDMNSKDKETNFTKSDLHVDNTHENMNGARKMALWLGQYLRDKYQLVDHRGDPAYESWDMYERKMLEMLYPYIMETEDYLQQLVRNDQCIIFIQNGVKVDDEKYKAFLERLGSMGIDIGDIRPEVGNGCWLLEKGPMPARRLNLQRDRCIKLPEGHIIEFASPTDLNFRYDGGRWRKTPAGLSCVVIDNSTGELFDAVTLFNLVNENLEARPIAPLETVTHF